MVSNKENIEHNSVKLLILSLLAFAFVLASSVGVFDKVYSITKGVQAGYRAEINVQAEKIDRFNTNHFGHCRGKRG